MTAEEYIDAFSLVRQVKAMLQEQFKPQGFNIGVNCGETARQSVFHAHIHLIPRYIGDVSNPRGGVRNIIPGKGNY
jgi:diadenosine tetraphosphate (Ap4A) HIT family hydrolase